MEDFREGERKCGCRKANDSQESLKEGHLVWQNTWQNLASYWSLVMFISKILRIYFWGTLNLDFKGGQVPLHVSMVGERHLWGPEIF